MHYFVSILVLQSSSRKLVALLLLSYRCIVTIKVSLALPHGAMGSSALCGCGIS